MAARYAAAWCSQNAATVADFFAPNGSLTHTGNGRAGAAGGVTVVAVFGIGREAGHDVGEACGSMVPEAEG